MELTCSLSNFNHLIHHAIRRRQTYFPIALFGLLKKKKGISSWLYPFHQKWSPVQSTWISFVAVAISLKESPLESQMGQTGDYELRAECHLFLGLSKIDSVPATLTYWTYASDIQMKGKVHSTHQWYGFAITPDPFSDGMYESPLGLERRWLTSAVTLAVQVPHSLAPKRNCQESCLSFKPCEIPTFFVHIKILQILILLALRSGL